MRKGPSELKAEALEGDGAVEAEQSQHVAQMPQTDPRIESGRQFGQLSGGVLLDAGDAAGGVVAEADEDAGNAH